MNKSLTVPRNVRFRHHEYEKIMQVVDFGGTDFSKVVRDATNLGVLFLSVSQNPTDENIAAFKAHPTLAIVFATLVSVPAINEG